METSLGDVDIQMTSFVTSRLAPLAYSAVAVNCCCSPMAIVAWMGVTSISSRSGAAGGAVGRAVALSKLASGGGAPGPTGALGNLMMTVFMNSRSKLILGNPSKNNRDAQR